MFVKARDTSSRKSFHDVVILKVIMISKMLFLGSWQNYIKFSLIHSIERVGQKYFTQSILNLCKDSSLMLALRHHK